MNEEIMNNVDVAEDALVEGAENTSKVIEAVAGNKALSIILIVLAVLGIICCPAVGVLVFIFVIKPKIDALKAAKAESSSSEENSEENN